MALFSTGELTEAKAVDAADDGPAGVEGKPENLRHREVRPPLPRRVHGVPRDRLPLTPAGEAATLVAYLFGLAPDGSARIITHQPRTLTGAPAGRPVEVSWDLQAAAYDLAADHEVMLVINAKDKFYSDTNPPLTTLHLGSTAGAEAPGLAAAGSRGARRHCPGLGGLLRRCAGRGRS
ncbi:hypothetical protein OG457_44660 [Streptomyces sp. NBC_01207]|nr:hypothetical protein OG457_44660 [Streptomyces sp. NBC_01207]